MPPTAYDPFKDESLRDTVTTVPPQSRRWTPLELEAQGLHEDYPRIPNAPAPGQRIDWGKAAEYLARGHTVVTTATLCSCDPQRIWRNLRRSRKFRARIDLAAERLRLEADLQFRNLNIHTVLQMRQRADKLDVKTLHWLAEKLRLGQAPAQATTLADWLEVVAAVPGPKHGRRARSRPGVLHPDRAEQQDRPEQDQTGLNGLQLDQTGSNGIELATNGIEPVSNRIEPAAIRPGSLHSRAAASCG